MPNRKIKHIIARLLNASSDETLDVYDVDAVHTDKIANDLFGRAQSDDQLSTPSGYTLDANQGKVLANRISDARSQALTMNSTLSSGDLNGVTDIGCYALSGSDDFTYTNLPDGVKASILNVFKGSEGSSILCQMIIQPMVSHPHVYIRIRIKNSQDEYVWSQWEKLYDEVDVADAINSVANGTAVSLTAASGNGVTFSGGTANYRCRRFGKMVVFNLKITVANTIQTNTELFSVPEIAFPNETAYLSAHGAGAAWAWVDTAGKVKNSGQWANGDYTIFGTYAAK